MRYSTESIIMKPPEFNLTNFQVLHGSSTYPVKSNIEYVTLCAIWYHFYNLKNVKNTHGRMLLLVEACNYIKK